MTDDLVVADLSVPSPPFGDALASAAAYALAQKAASTRAAYRADLARFYAWCESVQAATVPASAATVAAYLAHCADARLSVSTIQRRAAAIAYAHRLGGWDSPTDAEMVKATLRGIRRTVGVAARPKTAATADLVAKMTKRISDTLAGKRDRALVLLGFAAALRRSELVDLNVDSIERTAEGVITHIGRSKGDQEGAGASIAVPRGRKLLVIEALEEWLGAGNLSDGPIFRRIGKGDRLTADRLTGQSVALIVKRWALAAKLDPKLFSGHSLRSGFITSALLAGSDVLKLMDVTRHKDIATLKKYDQRAKLFKDHAGKGFL
jgi:site-specific recombinase XerD